ncbi:SNF2 helicase associated domain-containing protein [Peribacillus sp. B-H-3]|uniref:DEAD/DEAH box helicase n=1 Tax=Peribacillus sp. B-H-3 TaxID=3400420 RepID=UPI003B011D79
MNIKLTKKIIKELCGTVSFKRGEAFYTAKKVNFETINTDRCEATVTGKEEFRVIVQREDSGGFRTSCTCPTLASFQRKCQHVAAVLLAIFEHKHSLSSLSDPKHAGFAESEAGENGWLNLFSEKPIPATRHQLHFETRQVIHTEFICKLLDVDEKIVIGIEMKLNSIKINHIHGFLRDIKRRERDFSSYSFIYNPSLHCFSEEADTVLQHLVQVISDVVYSNSPSDRYIHSSSEEVLLIPPSAWKLLAPVFANFTSVKFEDQLHVYNRLVITKELLPLQFAFSESAGNGYQLKIEGMQRVQILDDYHSVFCEGQLFQLTDEDFKRLCELQQMQKQSGHHAIPISGSQAGFFLEKVVPGLKKLGQVQISKAITTQVMKTPLIAKLYLDRVKNRLLAGLEFHYGGIVINPLESMESPGSLLVRDIEKEESILEVIEDSSFAKTDGGYFMQNEELEYEFLYHAVPKLQKLVQIYATTAVRNRIFKGTSRPQISVRIKKERTDWLEFTFEMDGIPEKEIHDLLLALEEKRKYYRMRNGSLFSLETREIEEINRFLNAAPKQRQDLESSWEMPIVKSLAFLDASGESNIFFLEESFRQFLEKISNPALLDAKIPQSLKPIMRDYQVHGYKWMKALAGYGFGGVLADDMGLGKTLQSISYLVSELPVIRKHKQPALVVCPSSLTYNWLSEMMKFAPDIQAAVSDGSQAERIQLQNNISELDVIITSYPLLRRDIQWFEKQSFHTVFFDEAQAFKNPATQTARAVKKIQADHRFALTGTPVENASEELWSIFHVVFPELFLGLKEYSNLTRKTIARRIRPFMLRRLKKDILEELPGKMELIETADLLPEQRKLYAAYLAKLRHDTLKHLDKDTLRKNRIKILAGLTRLRQICCHPALFVDGYEGSSAKFNQLLQIIEESRLTGRRVLIFSQFTKMLELIGKEFSGKGYPFFYLDGHTRPDERLDICSRFNSGERDFFLISLKAGGTGLNLTGADTVILYDNWWNPAVEMQAADRAHRIGQKNIVQVIKLVARGTIEEKMNELQEKKKHLIEDIIDSEESKKNAALTEEDIRSILLI